MNTLKKALTWLLALCLFFGAGAISPARAETEEQKNQIILDGFTLEPLGFGTIFNMTDEELKEQTTFGEMGCVWINYKGLPYLIPFKDKAKSVIFDGNLNDENTEISYETLKKNIKNSNDKELRKNLANFNNVILEYIDTLNGETIVYFVGGIMCPNFEYFKKTVGKEEFKDITSGGEIYIKGELSGEILKEFKRLYQTQDLTKEEYLDFYKKAIPEMYWPVRLNLDNAPIHSNLPKLNKEMSELKFRTTDGCLYFITSEDYEDVKIVILNSKRDGDIDKEYDTFTGELIRTDKYTNSGKKVSYNEEYYKSIGIKDNKDERDQFSFGTGNTIYDEVFLKHPILKHFLLLFADCKNVGDMVEIYKYLPEEYIPEHYKTFDFTQSPNVVVSLDDDAQLDLENMPKNSSLPKLKDEALDLSFGNAKTVLYFFPSDDYEHVKLGIANYVYGGGETQLHDIYTGEFIRTMVSFKFPFKYNEDYFKKIGPISFKKAREASMHNNLYTPGAHELVDKEIFIKHPILKQFVSLFQDCETVRDVVEVYRYLPEEYIPEHYKTFDFTQSPNVVQPPEFGGK